MTVNTIELNGCASTPLSSYLKALGVFRLIANPLNHVTGTAADSGVRGRWTDDRFNLHSKLDCEKLVTFFLEHYTPTPITAPWNGGSGFYPKDNKTAFNLLSRTEDIAERFLPINEAIHTAEEEILRRKLTESPKDKSVKTELVSSLRGRYREAALSWVDAVLALSRNSLSFPPLLGTGGNDGRLDFTNNFMQRLVSHKTGLFDIKTGRPLPDTEELLRTSLFGEVTQGLHDVAIGQFSPGSAGGQNATSAGYEGNASVNPWDFILTLEGSIMFAGAATRRHQSRTYSGASFPFMVNAVGAGHGGISGADENSARAEFWAPLWNQSASYEEINSLLKEGRAVLNRKTARDGLGFARAAASLGISRGIISFERYGFVMRSGKAYFAVPLGKQKISSQTTNPTELIDDLDAGGWLERVRRFARKENSSLYGRQVLGQFENSLFEMTKSNADYRSIQNTLVALGDMVSWFARSADDLAEKPPPPPLLSSEWVRRAYDGTYEYRIASALASVGWQFGRSSVPASGSEETPPPSDSKQESTEDENRNDFRIPMAAHLAPVVPGSVMRKFREWNTGSNERLTVFTTGNLISGLIAILERRIIEQSIRNLEEKPLCAATHVDRNDISAFLSSGFNYRLCSRLLSGLVWTRPAGYLERKTKNNNQPPFPYAVLKPIFSPDEALIKADILPRDRSMLIPPGLVSLLRSDKVDDAVHVTLARTRASGIGSPFSAKQISRETSCFGPGISGRLLAASLLIPLRERDLKHVMERAYIINQEEKII